MGRGREDKEDKFYGKGLKSNTEYEFQVIALSTSRMSVLQIMLNHVA